MAKAETNRSAPKGPISREAKVLVIESPDVPGQKEFDRRFANLYDRLDRDEIPSKSQPPEKIAQFENADKLITEAGINEQLSAVLLDRNATARIKLVFTPIAIEFLNLNTQVSLKLRRLSAINGCFLDIVVGSKTGNSEITDAAITSLGSSNSYKDMLLNTFALAQPLLRLAESLAERDSLLKKRLGGELDRIEQSIDRNQHHPNTPKTPVPYSFFNKQAPTTAPTPGVK